MMRDPGAGLMGQYNAWGPWTGWTGPARRYYKTTEAQRKADREYKLRRPTLTRKCEALQEQVDGLKEQLAHVQRRLEELEEFSAKAATLLKLQ